VIKRRISLTLKHWKAGKKLFLFCPLCILQYVYFKVSWEFPIFLLLHWPTADGLLKIFYSITLAVNTKNILYFGVKYKCLRLLSDDMISNKFILFHSDHFSSLLVIPIIQIWKSKLENSKFSENLWGKSFTLGSFAILLRTRWKRSGFRFMWLVYEKANKNIVKSVWEHSN
jgi:hypothetical protein